MNMEALEECRNNELKLPKNNERMKCCCLEDVNRVVKTVADGPFKGQEIGTCKPQVDASDPHVRSDLLVTLIADHERQVSNLFLL